MLGPLCSFLSDYSALLVASGATGIRIERNASRIAQAYGCHLLLELTTSAVNVQLWSEELGERAFRSKIVPHSGLSFARIRLLSSLSWDISDGVIDFATALKRFKEIQEQKPLDPTLVRCLASLANASFCELFGGDFIAMGLVFLGTFAGFYLKQTMMKAGMNSYLTFLLSSFVASVVAAAGHVFGLGSTPEVALGTSILFLVPGIPYINSVCDMMSGNHILGLGRIIDATLLTASLSIGFSLTFLMVGLK